MSSEIRIIGGLWRGRRLRFSAHETLRPTPARVRETLFNWLGQSIPGFHCLDLFAGTGALGFEALSRGAERVTMVESNLGASRQLAVNARQLGTTALQIVRADALEWLSTQTQRFDLVFLDPPFQSGMLDQTLSLLGPRLNPGGMVYCESARGVSESPLWRIRKQARAGQVCLQLLEPGAEVGNAG